MFPDPLGGGLAWGTLISPLGGALAWGTAAIGKLEYGPSLTTMAAPRFQMLDSNDFHTIVPETQVATEELP